MIDSDLEIVDDALRLLLAETLGLDRAEVDRFEENTELFGALPEFDSMAVAHLLTALEERLGILIEDDAVEAEDFMTFGRLTAMARRLALD
ncbi:phosphopantetheine-binding protein [Sphingomicrobium lutaoense]|uniref:Acyl carrier protein n=1 Tax=Sphingomicrobium lutaoense TaxID=515949 RepID=A0A839YZU7_9SPHN|nr:phosphopantetheine-binding protein [Sphingomicrobium lutaoense]MBB3763848.1 acyl carrier protein [Sphingomicrobium lutaoense]